MKHYILVPILLVVLIVGFLWVRNARQGGEEIPPTTVSLGCTPTTGKIDANIIGIGQPGFDSASLVAKDLPYLKDLGVKWVRTDLWWETMEPNEGVYDWGKLDATVNALSQNNIKLLQSITYRPDWVRRIKDGNERTDAMYSFAKALATHNLGKVRYYEVFNEPNLSGMGFFGDKDKVNVPEFLDFLSAANRGIHEADPNAVIVLGGLSPYGMSPGEFTKQLYRLGGKDCFDVFAYHPYDADGRFKDKVEDIRAGMALYGDSGKPIWLNEVATNIVKDQVTLMNQMNDQLSVAQGWFWFSLRDFETTTEEGSYGLLTADYQKRPTYELFKQILKSR